jgi:hypothetical protein
MSATKPLAILIVTAALAMLFGTLHSPHTLADDTSIVGSWVVQVFPDPPGPPPFKNPVTSTRDGGSINYDPTFGAGHGVWKKVGDKTYATKFLTLVPPGFDPPFPPETTSTVTGSLTLNKQGDELTGPFQTVFTHPTTGEEIASFTGTVVLTRITID